MKSTPKIFGRIALVLRIILWIQLLLFIIYPIAIISSLDGFKHLFGENRLHLDTAGYYKHAVALANRHKGSEFSSMSRQIYSPKLKKVADSLIARNKQLKFYQNGKLIYTKSIDSLNKANPNWVFEMQLKLEMDGLNSNIKHTDSLIKIGHLTSAYFDSTGSMSSHGATRMSLPIKGGIDFFSDEKINYGDEAMQLSRDFSNSNLPPEVVLSQNVILTKIADKPKIEIIATGKGTFENKLIYFMSLFSFFYLLFVIFSVTFLLHRFFVRLSKGEIFSDRQGRVFTWIGFIFLLNLLLWFLYTFYQKYLITKYLAVKNAAPSQNITFEECTVPIIYLIVGLFCLALAQVFRYGMKIEKDNERTI